TAWQGDEIERIARARITSVDVDRDARSGRNEDSVVPVAKIERDRLIARQRERLLVDHNAGHGDGYIVIIRRAADGHRVRRAAEGIHRRVFEARERHWA